ncbi:MAG: hypothetical protein KME35_23275 [Aphanocapsa sp. GSE-SYN-MK-11-07L]|jgi:hypothetical protein|nr:hypothetical protein [Aphanocapsa sp. GSE-SYN-MK-11-07L]
MTQVLDKPPNIKKYTGSRFYLLAVSDLPTLYWKGLDWGQSKRAAKVFHSYDAAEQEQPQAIEKAPSGSTVIISPEA